MLEAPPPRFSADEVATIAAALFGLDGRASDLGSERDQTFLIDDGGAGGVLKISNLGEEAPVLELEIEGILHIQRVDPELPVAAPRLSLSDEHCPTWDGPDGPHFVLVKTTAEEADVPRIPYSPAEIRDRFRTSLEDGQTQ